MADKVRCETSFTTNGRNISIGQEIDVDDPLRVKYPQFFETPMVRTTATVPGPVTSPPPEPVKKATAKKATKRAVPRPNKGDDD